MRKGVPAFVFNFFNIPVFSTCYAGPEGVPV